MPWFRAPRAVVPETADPDTVSPSAPQRAWKQFGLVFLCAAWVLLGLFGRDPWKTEDAINFAVAWEMVQRQDFLIPHVAQEPALSVAPLVPWLAATTLSWLAPPLDAPDAGRVLVAGLDGPATVRIDRQVYILDHEGAPAEPREVAMRAGRRDEGWLFGTSAGGELIGWRRLDPDGWQPAYRAERALVDLYFDGLAGGSWWLGLGPTDRRSSVLQTADRADGEALWSSVDTRSPPLSGGDDGSRAVASLGAGRWRNWLRWRFPGFREASLAQMASALPGYRLRASRLAGRGSTMCLNSGATRCSRVRMVRTLRSAVLG